MLLPDSVGSTAHPHLLVGCGKEGSIYLVDRDQMGHYNPTDNSQIVQFLPSVIHGSWGNPAYFNGWVYYQGSSDLLKAFSVTNGLLSTAPVSQNSQSSWGYPNGTPAISANGTNNAIVWLLQTDTFYMGSPGILHAYNATNLEQEVYNSEQAGTRDEPGLAQKFAVPVIANGKVFVQGGSTLTVYGNLQAPQIVNPPSSQVAQVGGSVTLWVGASGPSPMHYQWQFGTTPIQGATNASLVITNLNPIQAGAYSVLVSNAYGDTNTPGAQIIVAQQPNLAIDQNQQITLTGTGGLAYQIQVAAQVGDQSWQPLSQLTLPGDSSSSDLVQASIADPSPPTTRRFYRAVVLGAAASQ
jgi:hypothetical protein